MNTVKVKRVVVYARVSTKEQAEQGYSIEAQKDAVAEECKRRGWKLVGEYVDAGFSGKEMTKRLEMQRLLDDLKKDKFDVVMAWSQSRLSRNILDYLQIKQEAKKYSVKIICLDNNNDGETPMEEMVNNVKALMNQFERESIVRNVKLGLKQRAQKGMHNGGRALGYKAVPVAFQDKKKIVIDESEAVIVRKIFNMYCEGRGLGYIANFLNKAGYRTVRGNTFSYCSIREIIDNPIYKGYVRYCRYENWREKRRKGKSSSPILVKGQHEPIISEDLWDKAALLREGRSNATARVYDSDNLLSSILKCPLCGSPMVVMRNRYTLKNGTKRINRYYICSKYKNKGRTACKPITVNADKAEKVVISKIADFLSAKEVVQMVLDKTKQKIEAKLSDKKAELESIQCRFESILKKKSKLLDLYTMEVIDKEMLNERIVELATQETALIKHKELLEAEIGFPVVKPTMEYVEKVFNNFDSIMSNTSREQKILLLRLLVNKVTVKNRVVDKIYLNLGGKLRNYIDESGMLCCSFAPEQKSEEYQDFILEL